MKFFVTYHPVRLISDSSKYTFTYEVQHNWFLPKVNVQNFNNHYCIRIINIITEDAGYTHYWFVLWYNMGNTEFSTFLNSTELFFHKKIFMMYLRNLVSNKFFFFSRGWALSELCSRICQVSSFFSSALKWSSCDHPQMGARGTEVDNLLCKENYLLLIKKIN